MEVKGKVKVIGQPITVSAKYVKRELVVTTDEQYPQSIMIEFGQDKCDLLNNLSIGQEVTIGINLGGREWVNPQGETKYFNSIKGWRIESLSSDPTPEPKQEFPPKQPDGKFPDNDNDLPF